MNYESYRAEDFAADISFRNWVNRADEEDQLFWDEWALNHPGKIPLMEEAVSIVRMTTFSGKALSPDEIWSNWLQLAPRLRKQETIRPKQVFFSLDRPMAYARIAAVLVGFILLSAAVALYISNRKVVYRTGYGSTLSVVLPDSSTVILNANSALSYNPDWEADQNRAVWLQGEAYFSVRKKKDARSRSQKFVVHTDNLSVEVLGTRFNVNDRAGTTEVVLASGKVKVSSKLPDPARSQSLLMVPGEMVEFSEASKAFLKRTVNTERYTAWKGNKLIFDNTPLQEVVDILTHTYGMEVQIKNRTLLSKKLTGEIEVKKVEDLLEALSQIYDLAIIHKNTTVIIDYNP